MSVLRGEHQARPAFIISISRVSAGRDQDAGHVRKARERRGLERRGAVRAADRAPQRRMAT